MKRCPKCGTVLDDEKKRCYMCGTDLLKSSITQFGESFDAQIGAAVTTSQDNVFNNVNDINANLNDAVGNSNPDMSTFTNSGADFYNNNLNDLNSMQYDNRTAIEKIFSGNQRFKSKHEINAEVAMKKNNKIVNKSENTSDMNNMTGMDSFNSPDQNISNNFVNNDIANSNLMNSNPVNSNPFDNAVGNPFMDSQNNNVVDNTNTSSFTGILNVNKENIDRPDLMPPIDSQHNNINNEFLPPDVTNTINKPVKEKKKIDFSNIKWGDNLKKSKLDNGEGFHVDVSLILNTACFIVFIVGVIFVYFKLIKPKNNNDLSFGGLYYKINEKFVLNNEDSGNRFYRYGEDCSLQISFGTNYDSNNSASKYFENIREQFSNEDGYITKDSKLDIQGNKWDSLEVLQIEKNDSSATGAQPRVKYRYVSIVYKGNYYRINFSNIKSNNECSAMYDEMVNSMEFKQ